MVSAITSGGRFLWPVFGSIPWGSGPERWPKRAPPSAGPFWTTVQGQIPTVWTQKTGPKTGPEVIADTVASLTLFLGNFGGRGSHISRSGSRSSLPPPPQLREPVPSDWKRFYNHMASEKKAGRSTLYDTYWHSAGLSQAKKREMLFGWQMIQVAPVANVDCKTRTSGTLSSVSRVGWVDQEDLAKPEWLGSASKAEIVHSSTRLGGS
jgi:hypothetical protein